MSKGFNYSKWDNIELSDDEDDVHANIDRESWFRMKHRSRVEREENEDKDKKNILEKVRCVTLFVVVIVLIVGADLYNALRCIEYLTHTLSSSRYSLLY
jgi:hypothetical protein